MEIALPESALKIKGTGVEFSRRAHPNLQNFLKTNGIDGRSDNIPIILVGHSSEIHGWVFKKKLT